MLTFILDMSEDIGIGKSRGEYWAQKLEERKKLLMSYTNVLEEYTFVGSDRWQDFPKKTPTDGWKFHLNVQPEKTKQVSDFLKENGFRHKFLSGGEIDSGKIFTVYTGSKKMTEKAVKEITDNLDSLLDVPKAGGEAFLAPKIVGRFEGGSNLFVRKACKDGICISEDRFRFDSKWTDDDVKYSREQLLEQYGEYFGGSITYYNPAEHKT